MLTEPHRRKSSTEVCQQMTRIIITTVRRFLTSINQIQLVILKFGDLGHQIGSFSPTQLTQK